MEHERDTFFGDKISPDDVTMITGAITYQLESRKNIYLNDRLFNSELEDAVAAVVKEPSFDLKTFEEQITNHITEEQTLTDFQITGAEEFNVRLRNGDFEYLSRYTRELSYEVRPETERSIAIELKNPEHMPEVVQELIEYFPRHGVDSDEHTLTSKEIK